ncbi:MAG: hypothetical protein KF770_04000 [Anaerolineae bacterium]|nr:hypothetical protein [Anaerolineae bacterium]
MMVQRKFQYILMGAGLTLVVVLGTLAILLLPAQASNTIGVRTNEQSAATRLVVEQPTADVVSGNEHVEVIYTATDVEVAQPVVVNVEEQPVSTDLGTVENPVTDVTKIIAQVQALGEIYQANVLGKSGWFYHRYEDYIPVEFLSNTGEIDGIPIAELHPDDTMIRQQWLLIDASGQSSQKVGYATDQEGIIRGRWAVTSGMWVNLHMIGASPDAIREAPPRLDRVTYVEDLIGILEAVQKDPLLSATAWQEDNVYILVLKARYEPPMTFVNINHAIFEGAQSIYTFDLNSGAIQQTEHLLQNVDGNFIIGERLTYLEQGYVNELPPTAAQIMNEATTLAGDAE